MTMNTHYGCDNCSDEIQVDDDTRETLTLLIPLEGTSSAEVYRFCSWSCLAEEAEARLKTERTNNGGRG
ncbi:MAG TPA: hypothetical protein PLB01_00060 [Thermoanaerobaculia bacterium]|nr:hypothetical protein [Thermoanaerobaculia bacterium]